MTGEERRARDPEAEDLLLVVLEMLRSIPAEVPAQLNMNLELLDAADAFHDALPDEFKARVAAMTDKQTHEQYVASLAGLPPETRARIRRCVLVLRDVTAFVSSLPEVRSGACLPRSPSEAPLRLVSCPGYAATA